MASKAFVVDWDDTKKVLEGAGVAATGAVLTYLSEQVIPNLYNSHDGVKLVVAALLMVGVNALRKYMTDTRPTLEHIEKLSENIKD